MMKVLYFSVAVFNCVTLALEDIPSHDETNDFDLLNLEQQQSVGIAHKGNTPYIERDENLLRLPIIRHVEGQIPKKKQKKNPKRTIQKIIKKNKMKSKGRKVYNHERAATDKPVKTTRDHYDLYEQAWNNVRSTTAANSKKKLKRWPSKLPRYHMPFQTMQMNKENRHKRKIVKDLLLSKEANYRKSSNTLRLKLKKIKKRQVSREIYVSKHFDEMKFLKGKDGNHMTSAR